MNLLLVAPRYWPSLGGVETHVAEVAPRLARQGIDVTVLCVEDSGRLPAFEERDGVRIRRVRPWPGAGDSRFAPGIYRIVVTGAWDVVHCQGYQTLVAPLAMLAALRAGVPYVVTFHGGWHSSSWRNQAIGLQLRVIRPLLLRARRLVAVAEFEPAFYARLARLPPSHFVRISNGCDLPPAPPAAPPRRVDPLVVSVGRLEAYKGHHKVIAALPHVIEHRPDVRLRIAGSGPDEARLHRLAERLGVTSRVEIGAVTPGDRPAMTELLSQASLVVLLSEFETQPLAALEAIGLGRTVLLARNSGMTELGDRGLARTIATDGAPREVGDAILDLLARPLTPPAHRLTTWDECAAQLAALYRGIAHGGTGDAPGGLPPE